MGEEEKQELQPQKEAAAQAETPEEAVVEKISDDEFASPSGSSPCSPGPS